MMLFVSSEKLKKNQVFIAEQIKKEIHSFLDNTFFILPNLLGDEFSRLEKNTVDQITQYKLELDVLVKKSFQVCEMEVYDDEDFPKLPLPADLSNKLILSLLRILATNHFILDASLEYIAKVGEVLDFPPANVDTLIEQVQYDQRKEFTKLLVKNLNIEQRYWIACMLWRAIHVDNRVHPSEYKYFENIAHLIEHDQECFNRIEKDSEQDFPNTKPTFVPKYCEAIFQYLAEIIMIDQDLDAREAKFIQEIGRAFEFDKTKQDSLLQPIASSIMLRRTLFV